MDVAWLLELKELYLLECPQLIVVEYMHLLPAASKDFVVHCRFLVSLFSEKMVTGWYFCGYCCVPLMFAVTCLRCCVQKARAKSIRLRDQIEKCDCLSCEEAR